MYNYEFNNVIKSLSSSLLEYNQMLYQIIIFITLYIYFNNLLKSTSFFKNTSKSIHRSFIILACILIIIIDWFVWQNMNNTVLFTALIIIYVSYNFQQFNIISTFANYIDVHNNK